MPLFRKKEYSVSVNQDDWMAPEETLIDSSSSHSDLEQPISEGVFTFAFTAMAALVLVLAFSAFKMTVTSHAYFSGLAFQNKTVHFAVAPPRGLILDRQGKPLVANTPSFDLLMVSRELEREQDRRARDFAQVARLLDRPAEEFAAAVEERVGKNAVFFAAQDLKKEQVIALEQLNVRGLYVITSTKRSYADGPQFSTVVGYTGKVGKGDLARDPYYRPADIVGRAGIEASYEERLRGRHGQIRFIKDGESGTNEDPVPGNTVVLNIDYDMQKQLHNFLYEELRKSGVNTAAAIAQDPSTGAVRAMVSFPDYDNNIFTREVSPEDYERLFESKSRPLFNRVIGGRYNPGSTIKPYIGMAAVEEKIIRPTDVIRDCVSITIPNPFRPSEPYVFKNWRVDLGPFNLFRALATSCNVYFFAVGGGLGDLVGLGADRIVDYLSRGFANRLLGVDLPGEEPGFLPTPEWKQEIHKEPWYQGDTYNISIGQGDLVVTPLWINSYVSAIANGGTLYKPQVANRIVDADKNTLEVFQPQALDRLPFSPDTIAAVRKGMREVVLSGTSQLLKELPVTVAAKSGTAEVVKGQKFNALFTAFAPYENPELAVTVLFEGPASNQGYATRTVHNFMNWYFSRQ